MLSLDPGIAYLKEVKILLWWRTEKFSQAGNVIFLFFFASQVEIKITNVFTRWGKGG